MASLPDSALESSFQTGLAEAQKAMRSRMDIYVAAWMAGDLDTILSYFVDEGLDYSDYGLMALHMNKNGLIEYFKFMGSVFGDMNIQTRAVHGAVDFCVWECTFEFTVLQDIEAIPYKKGERGKLFCASTIHWNGDGKIFKEDDYAVWANAPGTTH